MAPLEVARIARAHGLRGEVVVELLTNREERIVPGTRLFVRRQRAATAFEAESETLEITASRPFQHRFIVSFAGVSRREEAEALHGAMLLAEPIADPDELFVHELIGEILVDQNGEVRGTITAVQANPASDLLVVDDRFFVPVRFVTHTDVGEVHVNIPEGLFDE